MQRLAGEGQGIVSGRLSATGSANLGGSSGTTGPGVLVIA